MQLSYATIYKTVFLHRDISLTFRARAFLLFNVYLLFMTQVSNYNSDVGFPCTISLGKTIL